MSTTKDTITKFPRYGCMDPLANNYDPYVTTHDPSLCEYGDNQLIGCMDPLATNFNNKYTVPCEECCQYNTSNSRLVTSELPTITSQPRLDLDINMFDDPMCISNSYREFYDSNITLPTFGNGSTTYSNELFTLFNPITTNGINGFYDWVKLQTVFDRLRVGGREGVISTIPDLIQLNTGGYSNRHEGAYVFIDTLTKAPWVLPLIINRDYNTDNIIKLRSNCDRVGGQFTVWDGGDSDFINLDDGFAACICGFKDGTKVDPCKSIGKTTCVSNANEFYTYINNLISSNSIDGNSNLVTPEFWYSLGATQDQTTQILTDFFNPDTKNIIEYIIQQHGTILLGSTEGIDNQDCCVSNGGNWVNGVCLCEEKNYCNPDNSLVITINEEIIEIGEDCDEVTVSLYVYFEEPTSTCTGDVVDPKPIIPDIIEGDDLHISRISQSESREVQQVTSEPKTPEPTTPTKECCYDTNVPIEGRIIIQNEQTGQVVSEYIDTFNSQQTILNTNTNTGTGFNKWVRLSTKLSNVSNTKFNIALEFTSGVNCCCLYDIYIDDIKIDCDKIGTRLIYNDNDCPGFDLTKVIDNKKSWVYNPGKDGYTDNRFDTIVRKQGEKGLIEGHGPINRVFAPSSDANIPYRETDYYNQSGVIERHSKLVLNSKETYLTFNMCINEDCVVNGSYLIDEYGNYVTDEYGGRILLDKMRPLTLLELENYKKTFQGFWLQFIEQFIPATTIFISGEKWSNCITCEEKTPCEYELDATVNDGVSPRPVISTTDEVPTSEYTPSETNPRLEQTNSTDGDVSPFRSYYDSTVLSPNKIEMEGLIIHPLEKDLSRKQIYREIV